MRRLPLRRAARCCHQVCQDGANHAPVFEARRQVAHGRAAVGVDAALKEGGDAALGPGLQEGREGGLAMGEGRFEEAARLCAQSKERDGGRKKKGTKEL